MARIKPQALLLQSKKKKGPSQIGVSTIAIYSLFAVVMLFLLVSSYRYWSRRSTSQAVERSSLHQVGNKIENIASSDLPKYAVLSTSKGLITVELYKDGTPEIVDEFIDLCQRGHFKGMPFQHVIKHFIIQGGKVDGHGATEDWLLSGKHISPLDTSMKHEPFMLGTSKDKQDSEGFDLFITSAPIPDLSEKLIVFGRVVRGDDVVQEIEEVDTDEQYRPTNSIGVNDIALKQEL